MNTCIGIGIIKNFYFGFSPKIDNNNSFDFAIGIDYNFDINQLGPNLITFNIGLDRIINKEKNIFLSLLFTKTTRSALPSCTDISTMIGWYSAKNSGFNFIIQGGLFFEWINYSGYNNFEKFNQISVNLDISFGIANF